MEPNLDNAVLSGNSDPRAVMKGITHGACDYLLKPIRIEELKNIWQHVVRRKIDWKDQNNMAHGDDGENRNCETGSNVGGPADPTEKVSKKRKDQSEEEDDEGEENGHGNEDISTQKKPRVVWTVELHRKFVGAVNQLGIDKAVPKRILDIMNVDRLTRENVASHLQKYRLYLKRISNVASQQANIAAALGSKDLSYLHMGSLDVFGGFNSVVGSGHLSKTGLGSFHGAGTIDRLNSTSSLALRGLTSSGMIQLGLNNSGNSITDLGKMQQASFSGHQPNNVLQGMPHSLELDQLQQNKSVSHLGESSTIEDSRAFPVVQQQLTGLGGFPGSGVAASLCHSSFVSTSNSSLLQGHQQQAPCGSTGNQSSVKMGTLSPEPFHLHARASSHLPDRVSCNDSWQRTTQLPGYSSNSFPIVSPFGHGGLSSNNLRVSLQSTDTHARINPQSNAATSVTTVPLHDSISGGNPNCLPSSVDFSVGPLGVIGGNSKFSNFECMAGSVTPSINYGQKLKLEDHKLDYVNNQTFPFNSPLNSLIPDHGLTEPVGQNLRQEGGICNQSMYMTSIGQSVSTSSFNIQNGEIGKPTSENSINLKEDYFSENEQLHGGFNSNNCGPYDDLMSPIPIIKREREEVALIDGDIGGYDTFPLGICM